MWSRSKTTAFIISAERYAGGKHLCLACAEADIAAVIQAVGASCLRLYAYVALIAIVIVHYPMVEILGNGKGVRSDVRHVANGGKITADDKPVGRNTLGD